MAKQWQRWNASGRCARCGGSMPGTPDWNSVNCPTCLDMPQSASVALDSELVWKSDTDLTRIATYITERLAEGHYSPRVEAMLTRRLAAIEAEQGKRDEVGA